MDDCTSNDDKTGKTFKLAFSWEYGWKSTSVLRFTFLFICLFWEECHKWDHVLSSGSVYYLQGLSFCSVVLDTEQKPFLIYKTYKYLFFLTKFLLKTNFIILFIYLKIILFSIFSFYYLVIFLRTFTFHYVTSYHRKLYLVLGIYIGHGRCYVDGRGFNWTPWPEERKNL